MKTRSILLLSALALSMMIVSCNNKPNSRQNDSIPSQKEQVGSKMSHGQRNSRQTGQVNNSVKGNENQGRENFAMNMLTEEQKESFKTIRMNYMKEIQPLMDQLKELKLHEKTLMNADKPNLNEININIDKVSALQNKIDKLSAKMKVEISAQLTSEQKMKMKSIKNSFGKQGQKGKVMNNRKNRPQRISEKQDH